MNTELDKQRATAGTPVTRGEKSHVAEKGLAPPSVNSRVHF